jgi:hypothetical protein
MMLLLSAPQKFNTFNTFATFHNHNRHSAKCPLRHLATGSLRVRVTILGFASDRESRLLRRYTWD